MQNADVLMEKEVFDDVDDDEDYVQENDQELTTKRKKYQYIQDLSDDFIEDPVPKEYRYIWTGLQNARPEYQVLIEKMLSVYHMSYEQAEAAVWKTANELFDRKKYGLWKSYNFNVPMDANSLLQQKNVRNNPRCLKLWPSIF